jgi:hypothetical protein
VLVVIAFSLTLYTNASPLANVVIQSVGTIAPYVTANSGSAADIQNAVNQVATHGNGLGTVIIPAGNWTWYDTTVNVPTGVNIIGTGLAGNSGHPNFTNYTISSSTNTILFDNYTYSSPTGTYSFNPMFYVYGTPNVWGDNSIANTKTPYAPTRISGIYFESNLWPAGYGTAEVNTGGVQAIQIRESDNCRVDHCTFVDFSQAVMLIANDADNESSTTNGATCYGVVDHCTFTLLYETRNPGSGTYWSLNYGVYALGNLYGLFGDEGATAFTLPATSFFGYYGPRPLYCIVYVEDCHFTYVMQTCDAIQGGYYCSRFNLVTAPVMDNGGQITGAFDNHGTPGYWAVGGRGAEIYNDTVVMPTAAQLAAYSWWIQSGEFYNDRGGGSLIYNNTFNSNNPSESTYTAMIYLSMNDYSSGYQACAVNNTYLWSNTMTNNPNYLSVDSGIVLNTNYFEFSPWSTSVPAAYRFSYTPYQYPAY